MTDQDILLVVVLASSAVVITLADLLFSLWRHCRARRARASDNGPRFASPGDAAAAARREAIRRRLAAIQSAGGER